MARIWCFFACFAKPELQEWLYENHPETANCIAKNPERSDAMFARLYMRAMQTKDSKLLTDLLSGGLTENQLTFLFNNEHRVACYKEVFKHNALSPSQLMTWAESPKFSKPLARLVVQREQNDYSWHSPSEAWLRAAQGKLTGLGKLLLWNAAPDVITDTDLAAALQHPETWEGHKIKDIGLRIPLLLQNLLNTRPAIISGAVRSSLFWIRRCAAESRHLTQLEDQEEVTQLIALENKRHVTREDIQRFTEMTAIIDNPVTSEAVITRCLELLKRADNSYYQRASRVARYRPARISVPYEQITDADQIDGVISRVSRRAHLTGDLVPLLANPHVTPQQKDMMVAYLDERCSFSLQDEMATMGPEELGRFRKDTDRLLQLFLARYLPPWPARPEPEEPANSHQEAMLLHDVDAWLKKGENLAWPTDVMRNYSTQWQAMDALSNSFGANHELWELAAALSSSFTGTVAELISAVHAVAGVPRNIQVTAVA